MVDVPFLLTPCNAYNCDSNVTDAFSLRFNCWSEKVMSEDFAESEPLTILPPFFFVWHMI
jgi:hypothetical protein